MSAKNYKNWLTYAELMI